MSKKGIFLVLSRPKSPDQEAEYNRWYEEVHTRDSLLLPGFVKARRFKIAQEQLLPGKAAEPGFAYVAIYEVDDVDRIPEARKLIPELAAVSSDFNNAAMDWDGVRAFILEQVAEIDEPTVLPEGVEFPAKG